MESKQEPVLVSLKVSPWSLKARWALKHHRIPYRTQPYLPVLGELLLRWRLWKWSGKVTVPVLLTSEGASCDSFEIAAWADEHSRLPGGQEALLPKVSETMTRCHPFEASQ